VIGQRVEARIGRQLVARIEQMYAGGNQPGVDAIVLGALQAQLGEGAHLQRLQHDHAEAARLQMPGDAAFIAAGGLDADAAHAGGGEAFGELLPAVRAVVDVEALGRAVDRHVELVLAGVDAGAEYASIRHLRSTLPCQRTSRSGNHPGPMKRLARSCYEAARNGSGRTDPTPACPALGARPGRGAPFGTKRN
jgi:hypothetical protein